MAPRKEPRDWQKFFMQAAIEEAMAGVKKGDGGPFGAIVVRENKIIARAHNLVLKSNDPTAHAEITAIRKAARKLKTYDLGECLMFSTSEPCPMCLAAIHWARIKAVYYGSGREAAAAVGFDDDLLYRMFKGEAGLGPRLTLVRAPNGADPFVLWAESGKKLY